MDGSGSGGSTSSSNNNNITRWNPTKDQISILEGLYDQGMRTPTADQIQGITSRLKAFGHIEGKNVFYWFQNHKARQRQKEKELQQQQQQQSSCLSFSYMNRRCLYFHNCSTASPGLLYRAAIPSSSTNVAFRPYYVAQNESAGEFPALYNEVHLPSESNRSINVTNANDHADKLNLSLTTATPFSTELHENNKKSTLDLFPVHPTGIGQGSRLLSLDDEEFSGYMEDRPFFDFLSVNGCCGQD